MRFYTGQHKHSCGVDLHARRPTLDDMTASSLVSAFTRRFCRRRLRMAAFK